MATETKEIQNCLAQLRVALSKMLPRLSSEFTLAWGTAGESIGGVLKSDRTDEWLTFIISWHGTLHMQEGGVEVGRKFVRLQVKAPAAYAERVVTVLQLNTRTILGHLVSYLL